MFYFEGGGVKPGFFVNSEQDGLGALISSTAALLEPDCTYDPLVATTSYSHLRAGSSRAFFVDMPDGKPFVVGYEIIARAGELARRVRESALIQEAQSQQNS